MLDRLDDINSLREAARLSHEVGEGVVPVSRVSLGEEGGVLETCFRTITNYFILFYYV